MRDTLYLKDEKKNPRAIIFHIQRQMSRDISRISTATFSKDPVAKMAGNRRTGARSEAKPFLH